MAGSTVNSDDIDIRGVELNREEVDSEDRLGETDFLDSDCSGCSISISNSRFRLGLRDPGRGVSFGGAGTIFLYVLTILSRSPYGANRLDRLASLPSRFEDRGPYPVTEVSIDDTHLGYPFRGIPSQCRFDLMQLLHSGFLSSHLMRRVRHV